MAYRKILCAVDFSEPSRAAMSAAIDQITDGRGSLTLVHVHELPPLAFPEAGIDPRWVTDMLASAEKALAEWKRQALDRLGGKGTVDTVARQGSPWHDVVTLASERGCDLIVVGTHGRTGFKHVLLGSVAERIVRHASCAVLVAREKA
jgi:universal stress protein A